MCPEQNVVPRQNPSFYNFSVYSALLLLSCLFVLLTIVYLSCAAYADKSQQNGFNSPASGAESHKHSTSISNFLHQINLHTYAILSLPLPIKTFMTIPTPNNTKVDAASPSEYWFAAYLSAPRRVLLYLCQRTVVLKTDRHHRDSVILSAKGTSRTVRKAGLPSGQF